MTRAGLSREIGAIVGHDHVLTERADTAPFTEDWTGRWRGHTPCVALPQRVAELEQVVGLLARREIAYVPQGGHTGLVGGATPLDGGVVVSTRQLTGLLRLDVEAQEVVVRAGTTLAELNAAVARSGLELPIDFASRDRATVGGMVATDAAGLRSLRYGRMRAHVLGLEVVLPGGGRVDRLGRVPKDGTGYDLVGLLTGSEGTLGIVATARLRLSRRPSSRATALVALASVADAVALARTALGADIALESCELVEAEGVELVAELAATHPPLAGRAMLLLECASDGAPEIGLRQMLSGHPAVRGILVATEPGARHELWQWRERVPAAVSAAGIAHKLDVGVALSDVPVLLDGARSAVARLAPDARLVAFGHLGEGNLHLNVLGLAPDDERVDAALLGLVAELGGSIAAEHGVGRAKARYVALGRSAADLGAMAAVKRALDPGLLANPGVLFPPGSLEASGSTASGPAARRDEGGARW